MYIKSEKEVLRLIDKYFINQNDHLVLGRGDDCAELKIKTPYLALSTDLFLEDIHFRRIYFTPEEIGHKALAINLSDLAASGATPLGFALNLSLPKKIKTLDIEQIFQGISNLANQYKLPLCGGDLSLDKKLGFGIAIWGETKQTKEQHPNKPYFLRRSQAKEGDIIFVTGSFGLARLALCKLEYELKKQKKLKKDELNQYFFDLRKQLKEQIPKAMQAHLTPTPQLKESCILTEFNFQHPNCRLGLMDLSDGILSDLPRLLNSKEKELGAELNINETTLDKELDLWEDGGFIPIKQQTKNHKLLQSVYGGEDYVLFGTCDEPHWDKLKLCLPQIQELGRVTTHNEIILNKQKLHLKGFDHFQ
ncbi:thiamine-phosphate kinase [Desulfovibrio litoralis]|uniref:Thiamine-monophosphate kinase n=1 Tax=Desulfovibrio litoralis DSM 11393 TaxID=1121455 RepID=A0A1M7SYL8_9BACT|nr:thiamine-phosphate kinase [Desulfovibrio litoralis]SHN63589.1 thiamine-monophosphate kinase [Desulfovibrio litoralis DSM 11393]